MSGIDKIIFQVEIENRRGSRAGFSLPYIIDIARSNGLTQRPVYLDSERRYATGFMDRRSNRTIDGVLITSRWRGEGRIVDRLIINPSHLEGYGDYHDILSRIGAHSWLEGSYVSRIDFAADYEIPFRQLITGLDIADRENSRIYVDQQSGVPRSLYYGARSDILLAYDKSSERRRHRIELPVATSRLERQLRSARAIQSVLSTLITPDNLLLTLHGIAQGRFPILNAYTLSSISYRPDDELTPEQLRRRYRLQGMAAITSFATARRYINTTESRNFGRYAACYERTIWPEEEQPDAVLQQAVADFLRDAPRRRRTLPPPLPSEEDIAA